MKKTYIKPMLKGIRPDMEQVLQSGSLNLNDNGGTGTTYDEDAEGDAMSRHHYSVWE